MRVRALALLLGMILTPAGLDASAQRAPDSGAAGWLGINVAELRRASNTERGTAFESRFVVDAVDGQSGAALAGIRPGDVLVRVNGSDVNASRIVRMSESLRPGQVVQVELLRDGRVVRLDVQAGVRPAGRRVGQIAGPRPVFWSPPNGESRVGSQGQMAEFTITFRTDGSASSANTWSYVVEPGSGGIDFDAYAIRTSELDSVVVDIERLTDNLETLRIQRLASLRAGRQPPAQLEGASSRIQGELRELQDRLAVVSLRSLPRQQVAQDSVFRVRVPRSRALTPYLSVGSYLLGARIQDMDPALAEYFLVRDGVLVAEVRASTPAADAGMLAGDVVVRVNGRDITSREDLGRAVRDARDRLRLTVVRRGQRLQIELNQ